MKKILLILPLAFPIITSLTSCNIKKTIESCTWSEFINSANKGEEQFKKDFEINDINDLVGKTKKVWLDDIGEFDVRIIGIKQDYIVDKNDLTQTFEKSLFTFEFTSVVSSNIYGKHGLKPINNYGQYTNSVLRSYLNNNLFESFPAELKAEDGIKQVWKKTYRGYQDYSYVSEITEEKLFPLSQHEVNFKDDIEYDEGSTIYNYYNENDSDKLNEKRKKNYGNFGPSFYWLRTPEKRSSDFATKVSPLGHVNMELISSTIGVAPTFCVGCEKITEHRDSGLNSSNFTTKIDSKTGQPVKGVAGTPLNFKWISMTESYEVPELPPRIGGIARFVPTKCFLNGSSTPMEKCPQEGDIMPEGTYLFTEGKIYFSNTEYKPIEFKEGDNLNLEITYAK